jgi:glutathione S-transferase
MIIIYGSTVSPFVRKTLVVADEKGVEYELQQANMLNPSEDYLQASPFKKMPALRDGDFTVSDSTAIITYLEAIKPEPAMIPTEAKARATAIWYEEFGDTIVSGCGTAIFFNRFVSPVVFKRPGDEAAAYKAETEALPPILDYLEGKVTPGGYLVEDRFTVADAAVASPFVNLAYINVRPDPAKYPKLTAWLAHILGRPSFAKYVERDQRFFKAA